MKKRDNNPLTYWYRKFNVYRRELSDLIHKIKLGVEGNPNLNILRGGDIYMGNEWYGSVYECNDNYK